MLWEAIDYRLIFHQESKSGLWFCWKWLEKIKITLISNDTVWPSLCTFWVAMSNLWPRIYIDQAMTSHVWPNHNQMITSLFPNVSLTNPVTNFMLWPNPWPISWELSDPETFPWPILWPTSCFCYDQSHDQRCKKGWSQSWSAIFFHEPNLVNLAHT